MVASQHTPDLTPHLEYLRRQVGHLSPGRILDLGCGKGSWALAAGLLWPGATVLGLDINQESLSQARAVGTALASPADFHRLEFDDWPQVLPVGNWDLILMSSVLQYLDREKCFNLMAALLAPGGVWLCLNTHASGYYLQRTAQALAGFQAGKAWYYSRPLRWTCWRNRLDESHGGEMFLTIKHLQSHARAAGLSLSFVESSADYERRFWGLPIAHSFLARQGEGH